MKKFYILFVFLFGLNFTFAQSGTTDNVLPLPSGNFESDYFFDSTSNQMWFSFVADKDRMTFSVMHSASFSPSLNIEIDSIALYKKPGGKMNLIASAWSPSKTSDSLPAIQVLHLIPGNTYYLKLTKFNNNSSGYFNLSKIILYPSIIPPVCNPICLLGTNLICNGDFETLPAWAVGNCYADSSLTFPDNAPLPASVGYCISSPNMRNDVCNFGEGDFTDVYVISNNMGGQFQNNAENGIHFMGVDCPSTSCIPCRTTNTPGYIWTPAYRAIAWQQNVSVSNGNQYQFSCWLEDLDNESYDYLPGATVSIVINTDTIFSDLISYGNGYGSWKQVKFCWTANRSTAKIQIIGEGAASYNGYDFGVDNISFASTTSLNTISTITNVTCIGGNTGSASISVSGGVAPYTYLWTPGGGTNATETGLSAGTYSVTINDFNGCSAADIITISQLLGLNVSDSIANISCFGDNNGSAFSTASGGTSPYTYLWSGGHGTNYSATALSAGTYTVTVTDQNGCTGSASATITQPLTALSVLANTTTNVLCNGENDGSTSSSVSGGTTPYTYSWAPSGGSNASATSLIAGTYSLAVRDHNGCTATAITTITQPTALTVSAYTLANLLCYGSNSGDAASSVSGGTMPYSYLWAPSGETTATAIGLTAGTYTLTVKDDNGCSATANTTISQPTSLSVNATATNNVTCGGGNNGSASSTVTGGIFPYTYSWSNGGTSSTLSGLTAGTYTLMVNDNNGCVNSATVTITQPGYFTASATINENVSCFGENNGSATVNITGGTAPYTYLWTPSAQITATATGLYASIYGVLITDLYGCTTSTNVAITQPLALRVTASVVSNIPCIGGNNGCAISHVNGGTTPYTYLWSGGGGTNSAASGLYAGTYTLTVTDNNGCTGTTSVTIRQPDTLMVSATTVNVSCNGAQNGSATSHVSGGVLPYTYSWSNGATTANATNLGERTYTLTVQDSCGGMAITTVTITQPTALSILSYTMPDIGNCLGSAWVDASGGTPAYTYSWIPGGNTTDSIHNRCPGSYCCTITDAHGCMDSVCITITSTAGVDNISSNSGQINVYPNPNNGQFTIVLGEGSMAGASIEIYNVIGQDIKSEKLKTNSTVINLNNQANGLYLYRVLQENGNLVGSGKLIIQK